MKVILPLSLFIVPVISSGQAPTAAPPQVEIGKPFVIDGIEITLDPPEVGTASGKPQGADLPEAEFFKMAVKLRNTSDSIIVTVQDPWRRGKLSDEFGNFYRHQTVGLEGTKTSMMIARLRPAGEVHGTIFFEPPLPGAKTLTLVIDPGFYRETGGPSLTEISAKAFKIELKNPSAKP